MKGFLLTIVFVISSITTFSQTRQEAVALMNVGNYKSALLIIEGLEAMDIGLQYDNLRKKCVLCLDLHSQANGDIKKQHYTDAIKKYQTILQYNPNDKLAKSQIEKCKQLRTRYYNNQKKDYALKTYYNSEFGYSIQYPSYLVQQGTSFASKTGNINLRFETKVFDVSKSNYDILDERRSYHKSLSSSLSDTITYTAPENSIKNWLVLSGRQWLSQAQDSLIYYEKSFVVTRTNQYGEIVKLRVTAHSTIWKNVSQEEADRGDFLAKMISAHFQVLNWGNTIKQELSDDEHWNKVKIKGTIEDLENYIKTAPTYSKHLQEARTLLKTKQSVLAIERAEKYYREGNYLAAKMAYEQGESLLSLYEREHYNESRYQCCLKGLCDINDIQKLMSEYEKDLNNNLFRVFSLRGCIIKRYCAEGQFSKANNYLERYHRRDGVWNNERPYSKSQWRKYIKQQEKTYVRIGSWTTSRSIYK